MELLIPHWPDLPPHIGALSSLRKGGVSQGAYADASGGGGMNMGLHVGDEALAVAANRQRLRRILPGEPKWLHQVHGIEVVDAANCPQDAEADASFTNQRNIVCAIQTADCLPVLFCDQDGKMVAAAHAGWRGLAAGVLQQTVRTMRAGGAASIRAWLGPAIGPQQFEVGAEVLQAFAHLPMAATFVPHPRHEGKYLLDIYQLARRALAQVEVLDVVGGEYCTVSSPQQFYSYRRDHCTGRMVSCIWIK